jgi:anti-anti-sigma factor
MNLQVEQPNPTTAILHLNGRLDANTQEAVKKIWISDEKLKYIIADMANTTFIDSLGMAALVSGMKAVRTRSGDFYIVNPGEVVRLLLELTRMDAVFRVVATVEEALCSHQLRNVNQDSETSPLIFQTNYAIQIFHVFTPGNVYIDSAVVPDFRVVIVHCKPSDPCFAEQCDNSEEKFVNW